MPVTIGVSLEEDGVRGILKGVSGDGERFGEVQEVKDRAREKELFQLIKGTLTGGSPIPVIVFLGEI